MAKSSFTDNGNLRPMSFKFTVPLPLTVDGGLTTWVLSKVSHGRETDVLARCQTTGEVIHLVSGRSRMVDGVPEGIEFLAWPNTKLYLIARKLIRDGRARCST